MPQGFSEGSPLEGGRAAATTAGRVLELGGRRYDLATSALVMGILNRTKDSFYDKGSHFEMDRFLRRAEALAGGGADILDIGGVKAGPGEEIGPEEELERVLPAVAAVHARFDLPISVDSWRSEVAAAAFGAGAVLGNDISGFADPGYLAAAAVAGAAVVSTHIRLAPRVPDPDPVYRDVVAEVTAFLCERASRARNAGIPAERIVVDAGLDLGKTAEQSLLLLRASRRLAGLGYPLLVSASNKPFLGVLLGLDIDSRGSASLAAVAIAIAGGARICRVHDVAGTRRVRDVLAAILEADPGAEEGLATAAAGDEAACEPIGEAGVPA